MKKLLAWAAVMALCLSPVATGAEPGNKSTYDVLSPIVQLAVSEKGKVKEDGYCTGFAIGGGFFVTAGHCVSSETFYTNAVFENGKALTLKLAAMQHPQQGFADFAIYQSVGALPKEVLPLKLGCYQPINVGQEVWFQGYPADLGVWWGKGFIAGQARSWWPKDTMGGWKHPVIPVTATITYGVSGAPMVDKETAKVIGIIVGGLPKNQSLAVAQSIDLVCDALGPDYIGA